MTTTKLSAYDTSTIEVRPLEIRDEAYVTVNEHHFALQLGVKTNISSVVVEGANILQLFVTTYALPERLRRGLADKDWCGRFEIHVDGKLFSSYAQSGAGLLGNSKHNIASIELTISKDQGREQKNLICKQIASRLQLFPGMTSADKEQLQYAVPCIFFKGGATIHTWKNIVGVDHVFITDPEGSCFFSGYVGWSYSRGLNKTLSKIRQEFSEQILH